MKKFSHVSQSSKRWQTNILEGKKYKGIVLKRRDLKPCPFLGRAGGHVVSVLHLLLWRSEFESRWSLQFFLLNLCLKKNESKENRGRDRPAFKKPCLCVKDIWVTAVGKTSRSNVQIFTHAYPDGSTRINLVLPHQCCVSVSSRNQYCNTVHSWKCKRQDINKSAILVANLYH